MTQVGAFEAKTRFSQLLDRVEQGEEIVITRHGKAVAVLKAVATRQTPEEIQQMVQRMRELRRGTSLEGLTIKELTHGGHKY